MKVRIEKIEEGAEQKASSGSEKPFMDGGAGGHYDCSAVFA